MKEPEKGQRVRKLLSIFSRSQRYRNIFTIPPKTQKPLVSQGLEFGAGDRGRTDDLMLGKHTL